MSTRNLCKLCSATTPHPAKECGLCGQPLVREARGAISIWCMDDIEDGLVGRTAAALGRFFERPIVVQPGHVPADRSESRGTKHRLSADAFLDEIDCRHVRGTFATLGLTARNIASPPEAPNFVFGLGYMGRRTAVMSFHQLKAVATPLDLAVERAVKIATHELGHALGLDHHSYTDGVRCTMVGDVEVDRVPMIDRATAKFCGACRAKIERRVGRLGTAGR